MINLYGEHYKKYLLVPLALFILFLFLIFIYPQIPKGLDLKGGTMIIIRADKEINSNQLETLLIERFPLADLSVSSISSPTGFGTIIQYAENKDLAASKAALALAKAAAQTDPAGAKQLAIDSMDYLTKYTQIPSAVGLDVNETISLAETTLIKANESFQEQLLSLMREEFDLGEDIRIQKREIGATLGETFWSSAITVSVIAFILVILVIFAFFREIIPSMAVIAAAVLDISGALALMAVFAIPLSLSSIPALLMLIGYSVDTDIMLTTRLLKRREKTPGQRTTDAMKTGLTMTFTTLAALVAMLVLSYLTQIFVIFEIAAVLFFGLCTDIISTWLMNAPVLLWYVERKGKEVIA